MPLGLQVYCIINRHGDKGRKVNMALQSPNSQYGVKNLIERQQIEIGAQNRGSYIHT